ncbi:hypothetical protein JTB14_024061 [Gonioctena quinquepunctata]|nr:hypothetical protein JTB14_024061 [Gonioctena quinquepunctata]
MGKIKHKESVLQKMGNAMLSIDSNISYRALMKKKSKDVFFINLATKMKDVNFKYPSQLLREIRRNLDFFRNFLEGNICENNSKKILNAISNTEVPSEWLRSYKQKNTVYDHICIEFGKSQRNMKFKKILNYYYKKYGMKNKVAPKNSMYIDRKTEAFPIADIKSDDSDPEENLGRNDISFENVANSTPMHHSTVLVPLSSENQVVEQNQISPRSFGIPSQIINLSSDIENIVLPANSVQENEVGEKNQITPESFGIPSQIINLSSGIENIILPANTKQDNNLPVSTYRQISRRTLMIVANRAIGASTKGKEEVEAKRNPYSKGFFFWGQSCAAWTSLRWHVMRLPPIQGYGGCTNTTEGPSTCGFWDTWLDATNALVTGFS